jgi:signal transduction histidine kinase/ligand-binding sensor domain-containing protein
MLTSLSAMALGGDRGIRELHRTTWTAREGAPTAVRQLTQTSDGYLWIADATGLYRFDSLRFEHLGMLEKPELAFAEIYSLFAPKTGGLWVGYTLGGAAFVKEGKNQFYGAQQAFPNASVTAFAEQDDGTMWIGTSRGLGRLRDGRWERLDASWNLPTGRASSLMSDSAGALWVYVDNELFRLGKGLRQFASVPIEGRMHPDEWNVLSLAEAPDGSFWISNGALLQRIYTNGASGHSWSSNPSYLTFDTEGAAWASLASKKFGQSIVRFAQASARFSNEIIDPDSQKDRLTSADGFSLGFTTSVFLDHEGNVWLAGAAGLVRFTERNLQPTVLGSFDGLQAAIIAGDGGSFWVTRADPARWDHLTRDAPAETLTMDIASVGTRARSGSIWIGTRFELFSLRRGRFERTARPDGTHGKSIQAIAEDADGRLWISVIQTGLFRLKGARWELGGGIAALGNSPAVVLADDRDGRIWAGYPDDKVGVIDGDKVRFLGRADGLNVGHVTALFGRRKAMWVGGDAGLARIESGHVTAILADEPAALGAITGLVETENGDLWMNAAAGIVHVLNGELAHALNDPTYRISTEIFDAREGLEGTGARFTPLPTLIEGTDGILWAVTTAGAYSIDPDRIFRSPITPKVRVRSVIANDKLTPVEGDIQLPSRTTALRILYEGLSLTAGEQVRYRYRLDGVDKDWRNGLDRREAYYTEIGPGTYLFHVQARIAGAPWSDEESSVSITIPPTFTQTRAFLALCALSSFLAVWIIVRLRVGQLGRRLQISMSARIAERERIARDLHDTLLQGVQGLMLTVHAAVSRLATGHAVRTDLEQAVDQGDRLLAEGRDLIQDLRLQKEHSESMADSLRSVGANWRAAASDEVPTFVVQVKGDGHPLNISAAEEIYRVAREAIANSFLHSRAKLIEVQIRYEKASFRILVRDNGRGIDADVLRAGARPGHWGLQGMTERVQALGGYFSVRSSPGAGTDIELRLPAHLAYADFRKPRSWWERTFQRGNWITSGWKSTG